MDYNDIKSRLSRTRDSLNNRYDDDVDKHVRIEKWSDGRGESLFFGSENESELLNKIMMILYNLASLKDLLKNSFASRDINAQIVEDEINNSIHLQVLIDIVNQDKHGSPLRNSRSKKGPEIIGLRNGMFMADIRTNEEKFTMRIYGSIVDNNGNRLFSLDDLVDVCFNKLDGLFTKYS